MPASGAYGDVKRLGSLFTGLGLISSPVFMKQLSGQLAEEARAQVNESFEQGVDPYGKPWKPNRWRGGQTLRDTGRLQQSIGVSMVNQEGFELSTNVKYAAIHNYGGIIKAKTAKGLVFRVRTGTVVFGARGQRLQRRRGVHQWFRLMQVVLPKRQFIPTGNRLGARWSTAFREVAKLTVEAAMGGA